MELWNAEQCNCSKILTKIDINVDFKKYCKLYCNAF